MSTAQNPSATRARSAAISDGLSFMARWSLRLALIGLGLALLWWLIAKLWVIVMPVLLALLISTVLYPPTAWLRRRGAPPALAAAAVLLGGFLIHGMTPGPMLFTKHYDVVMGLYAGKVISLFALLIVAYLILRPCIWLVNRPKHYLMAFIFALVLSGVYAIHNSLFHVGVALAFGPGLAAEGIGFRSAPRC